MLLVFLWAILAARECHPFRSEPQDLMFQRVKKANLRFQLPETDLATLPRFFNGEVLSKRVPL
jgi:hypothetical protein